MTGESESMVERPIGLVPPPPDRKPHPANGMTAVVHVGGEAFIRIVDPRSHGEQSAEWALRYGDPLSIRFSVASLIASYDFLLAGDISTTEAVRRLRILRQAYAALSQGDER